MTPADIVGKIATFYLTPAAVRCCCVQPGAQVLVGEIIEARACEPTARGRIPNAVLKIKGRSGKIAVVDYVEQHVRHFTTWADALAYSTT